MKLTPRQFINALEPFAAHKQKYYEWIMGEYVEYRFSLSPGATSEDWHALARVAIPADLKALLSLSNGISLFVGTKYPGPGTRLYSTSEISKALAQPQDWGVPFLYLQDSGELYYREKTIDDATREPEIVIPYAGIRLTLTLMTALDYFMRANGSDEWYGSLGKGMALPL